MNRTWLIAGTVVLGGALAALVAVLPVLAQDGGEGSDTGQGHAHVGPARRVGDYSGVTPGESESPPAEARARRRAQASSGRRRAPVHLLTWPGFQMREDGSSRFFLQTSDGVQTETSRSPGRFVLLLKDTRVHLRTNALPLETRFFDTPVVRAVVQRRGHDLAVVFTLRAEVAPRVHAETSEQGYHYIYVDFPDGDYLPAELRAREDAPSEAPADEEGPTGDEDAVTPGGIRVYDEPPPGS